MHERRWVAALMVLFALFGAARAIGFAWLADDAYISFRYADNLAAGLGLVFNAGEYVEGYTNLLWTLLLAAAIGLGAAPEAVANVLGIVCWLGLAACLFGWSVVRAQRDGGVLLPLAAAMWLLMPDAQRFATGGLETSLFAWLSALGLMLAVHYPARRSILAGAGLVLALATLTRPDGALFAALGVIAIALRPPGCPGRPGMRGRYGDVLAVMTPLVLVGAALVAFKLRYYGELLPTAFYAKSAASAWYEQGLYYVYLFMQRNWVLVPLLALLVTLRIAHAGGARATRSYPLLVFAAAATVFTLYVAHSGGDFMYGRRMVMVLPCWLLVAEELLAALSPRSARGIALAALLACALPASIYARPTERLRGIAQEHAFYPPSTIALRRAQGERAAVLFAGTPLRAMFSGGMCMFAYYSQLPWLAEMTGLTHYSLARQPLAERGHVGHEKRADDAWLRAHGVDMVFLRDTPPAAAASGRDPLLVRFGNRLSARLVVYRHEVMDPLRERVDVDFVPIEQWLAQAQAALPGADPIRARAILGLLDRVYFSVNPSAAPRRRELYASAGLSPP